MTTDVSEDFNIGDEVETIKSILFTCILLESGMKGIIKKISDTGDYMEVDFIEETKLPIANRLTYNIYKTDLKLVQNLKQGDTVEIITDADARRRMKGIVKILGEVALLIYFDQDKAYGAYTRDEVKLIKKVSMKFKIEDRVKVRKIFADGTSRSGEMQIPENRNGVIISIFEKDHEGFQIYLVRFDNGLVRNCNEDQMELIKETTMECRQTISLEDAYNAGMCKEGLKRFLEIIDIGSSYYCGPGTNSIWKRQYVIRRFVDKLNPCDKVWLKLNGYYYGEIHEYRAGDKVQVKCGNVWKEAIYLDKEKNTTHHVWIIESRIHDQKGDENIMPMESK